MEDDFNIIINSSLFNKDLDEVGWEPEIIDDSDKESEDMFGYK